MNKYISNPLDISLDAWNKIESQEDFFQIFQKIKENMIQLQNKCQEQEETIERQNK